MSPVGGGLGLSPQGVRLEAYTALPGALSIAVPAWHTLRGSEPALRWNRADVCQPTRVVLYGHGARELPSLVSSYTRCSDP